jgi:hypothetical protein
LLAEKKARSLENSCNDNTLKRDGTNYAPIAEKLDKAEENLSSHELFQ